MDKDVQHYIDSIPADRRPLYDQLHKIITGLYLNIDIISSYGIPRYKSKSGWVSLGFHKSGVSMYFGGSRHMGDFEEKYPAIKTGKACLNFATTDKVPVTAVKKVIKNALENVPLPKAKK